MLVLTRKVNETIIIGDIGEIEVTVVEVRGDQVRLGITAPRHVTVDRSEIAARKKADAEAEAPRT